MPLTGRLNDGQKERFKTTEEFVLHGDILYILFNLTEIIILYIGYI